MTLSSDAASGNQLKTLRSLRDKIAAAIDSTDSGRDIAALSRQLTDVMEKIAELERINTANNSKEVPLNVIAMRHNERRNAAKSKNIA